MYVIRGSLVIRGSQGKIQLDQQRLLRSLQSRKLHQNPIRMTRGMMMMRERYMPQDVSFDFS